MAMQVVADGQAIEVSELMPPVTGTGCHVTPASLLTNTEDPTAIQRVVVGQATAPIPTTWGGTELSFQVNPPSTEP
jgi:hypothetical protein